MIVDAFLFLSILSFLDNFTLFVNKTNLKNGTYWVI